MEISGQAFCQIVDANLCFRDVYRIAVLTEIVNIFRENNRRATITILLINKIQSLLSIACIDNESDA